MRALANQPIKKMVTVDKQQNRGYHTRAFRLEQAYR